MNGERPVGAQYFVDGPVEGDMLMALLDQSQAGGEASTGAQSCFFGRVRADLIDGQNVVALEYEAYVDMAIPVFGKIIAETIDRYGLVALSAIHSLGRVPAGELCFAVAASAVRRKAAMEGCRSAVERIKAEVPIFAREILEDGSHLWKRNS